MFQLFIKYLFIGIVIVWPLLSGMIHLLVNLMVISRTRYRPGVLVKTSRSSQYQVKPDLVHTVPIKILKQVSRSRFDTNVRPN